jgi:hypothetical protein
MVMTLFPSFFKSKPAPRTGAVQIGHRTVPLLFVPHPRARRYLLRLRADGVARVTVPRRGSISAAKAFVARNLAWLEQQFQRQAAQPQTAVAWRVGTELLFRGVPTRIEAETGWLRFGTERIKPAELAADLRPALQTHLRRLARRELPARVREMAAPHQIAVNRITIRNQKTRWGSCSRRGTISLNWRLIQAPDFVRDYIIWHELAHRRHMNHSPKFWQEVAQLCPEYRVAETWLKQHAKLLR